MHRIKLGVIGLGRMGMLHLRNVRFIEGVLVEAVADRSKKELAKASSLGVKNLFSDFKDIIDHSSLDVVIIALPHFLHEEAVVLYAEKELHIFIEKPLGGSVEECERIIEAAEGRSQNTLCKPCCSKYERLKTVDLPRDLN